jgi:hypothetical protein
LLKVVVEAAVKMLKLMAEEAMGPWWMIVAVSHVVEKLLRG